MARPFTGCRVHYKVYADDLLGMGQEHGDARASSERYGALLEKRLVKALPGARVSVDVQHGVGGYGSGVVAECMSGRQEELARDLASATAESLFEDHRAWFRRK